MDDIQTAEKTLAQLVDKKERATARGIALADERQGFAFAAHTGDRDARSKLDKINAEAVLHASEIESINAAIAEAQTRLAKAQQAAAVAMDKASARKLKAALDDFTKLGAVLDAALTTFVEASSQLHAALNTIHACGSASPSHQQVDTLGRHCLLTALGQTIWARDFERLAPNQRRSFKTLIGEWTTNIERNAAAPRIGEEEAA